MPLDPGIMSAPLHRQSRVTARLSTRNHLILLKISFDQHGRSAVASRDEPARAHGSTG